METDAIHELTAAYALDALDADEERAYEEHLARCPQCREELAGLSETAAALGWAAGAATPPADLRDRILDSARAERPTVVPLRPRWAYPVAALGAAAACLAIGFGVWAATLHGQLGDARQALRAVPLQGAVAGSVVLNGEGDGTLVLAGLSPAPAGKTYEAWVMHDGAALPAGLFRAGGKTVAVHLTQKVPRGAVVGVTLERAGGAERPSLPPVVASSPA